MMGFLSLYLLFAIFVAIQGLNPKKEYCGNEVFVPKIGYPQLRCGEDFLTYDLGVVNRYVIRNGKVSCDQVAIMIGEVNATPTDQMNTVANKAAMKDILVKVQKDECNKKENHLDDTFKSEDTSDDESKKEESQVETEAEM